MFLLGAIVFARSCDSQPEQIAIEPEAGIRIGDHDGGVVDSQKQPVARVLPPGIAFPSGNWRISTGVFIRVFEVESF